MWIGWDGGSWTSVIRLMFNKKKMFLGESLESVGKWHRISTSVWGTHWCPDWREQTFKWIAERKDNWATPFKILIWRCNSSGATAAILWGISHLIFYFIQTKNSLNFRNSKKPSTLDSMKSISCDTNLQSLISSTNR